MTGMVSSSRRRLAVVLLLAAAAAASAQTVYITRTGTKYHGAGCTLLKKSHIAIGLSDAIARGFTPCGLCNPPTTGGEGVVTGGAEHAGAPAAAPSTGEARNAVPSLYRVNVAGVSVTAGADVSRMLRAHVFYVVDGDTVKVSLAVRPKGLAEREIIRLIGVDTPETVDRRKPVQPFGKEASAYTRRRLLDQDVYLAFDWDLRDKYNRLLAYVYLAKGGCFNAELVREGYAHAYLTYAFQFTEEFRGLERKARESRRGLWGPG
jgi:micrococcal nuclease